MKPFSYFIACLAMCSLLSCKDPNAALRADLDQAIFKIDILENQLSSAKSVEKGDLVHLVYLNLKDDLTEQEASDLVSELYELRRISELKHMTVGNFEDLGDQRAMGKYELVISMSFDDTADYMAYQKHPIHIKLKEALDVYIAGPPATYHYIQP